MGKNTVGAADGNLVLVERNTRFKVSPQQFTSPNLKVWFDNMSATGASRLPALTNVAYTIITAAIQASGGGEKKLKKRDNS